jgi:redox-sensitive bicupin YhaK (pirin superfamily)
MMTIHPAEARGRTRIDWLDSRHSFSFGDYQDPKQMGFRTLRVINDDRVAPAAGFGMHGHRDMEIITYVLDGALEHRDSLGTGEVLRRGDVQRMTAGTGIRHSEFNPSQTEPAHFLQIWLFPERRGLTPGYEQKNFPDVEKQGRLRLIAAAEPRDGALKIHQDVDLYASVLGGGESATHEIAEGRSAWVQVARGSVELNGTRLAAGDGASVLDQRGLEFVSRDGGEFLLFDLN